MPGGAPCRKAVPDHSPLTLLTQAPRDHEKGKPSEPDIPLKNLSHSISDTTKCKNKPFLLKVEKFSKFIHVIR